MKYIDFISPLHKRTKRDYIPRIASGDKAECSETAKKFGVDYWDGDRKYGYGGYRYDGRWKPVAEQIASYYNLKEEQSILDVGCGKGFLMYELTQVVPGLIVSGLDISCYAVENCKEEIRPFVIQGDARELPYQDKSFDLVVSINTLHNLKIYDLKKALGDIARVCKNDGNSYICVESYRSEQEKINLFCWQLTCESFYSPDEWEWIMSEYGYRGDYSFIFFE